MMCLFKLLAHFSTELQDTRSVGKNNFNTLNEQSENEIKKLVPLTITPKTKVKFRGIDF